MIKYKTIKPHPDEEYQIAYDDKCLVVKVGKGEVWISKAMARWISLNFAGKINTEIKFINNK